MITKEKLEELINKNLSTAKISKDLKISQSTVRHWLTRYNLKTNFKNKFSLPKKVKYCINCEKEILTKGAKLYCNTKCQQDYQYKQYIDRWKQDLENGRKGKYSISDYIRKYLFSKYDGRCSKCGWREINPVTKKVPLHIEHKDGNYKNNKEENLDLLCPNCHSLTPTYGALNAKSGLGRHKKYI